MIALKSSDDKIFEIEEEAAMQSKTLCHLIEDGFYDGTPIPIPKVSSYILEWVIEYCHRHSAFEKSPPIINISFFDEEEFSNVDWDIDFETVDAAASPRTHISTIDFDDINKFDEEFVKVDWETLFETANAASYLNIESLIDLTCKAVYDYIALSDLEEIYQVFNLKKDFTPEEEDQMYKEHEWAFRLHH